MTAPADSIDYFDSISPLAKLALSMRIARAADFRDVGRPRRARPRGERGAGAGDAGGSGSGGPSGAAKT